MFYWRFHPNYLWSRLFFPLNKVPQHGYGKISKRFVHLAGQPDLLLSQSVAHNWIAPCCIFRTRNNTIGRNHFKRSTCLLYTSDAADEEDSVDLGGRRIIKKKKKT